MHVRFSAKQIALVRAEHPGVRVIVHPEVPFDVVQAADDSGSTEYILSQVRAGAPGSVWAVGTEVHLVHRLAAEVAPHGITVLSLDQLGCLCSTMFRVSPNHLLWVLEGLVDGQVHNQVEVPEHQIHWGRVALDRMLPDPLIARACRPRNARPVLLRSQSLVQTTSRPLRRLVPWLMHCPRCRTTAAALEPHIDTQTMEIHHGKHHQAYVTNLNAALDKHPELHGKSLDELVQAASPRCPRTSARPVRNNGGGHWNHSLFWTLMAPGAGGAPTGDVADGINAAFGSFDKFKEQFQAAGMGRFGSGWAWLIDNGGKLEIASTPNQDNPLMDGKKAILGVDVWEHAYYLKYQNRRADYMAAFWNVVNWTEVNKLLRARD